METYTINDNLVIQAWSWRKSGRWGHEAKALWNGREIESTRITYLNRTWESYQYQSVMQKLIDRLDESKDIPLADRIEASRMIKMGDRRDMKKLGMIGAFAMLGDVIAKDKSQANKFKHGILKRIPGLEMPDDFDSLTEDEKSRRLDGAINILTKE